MFGRVRRALAHDLRTPLGTIANYAAILEAQGELKPENVRAWATRIRSNAVRVALMLQCMTDAIDLAERDATATELDPSGLVRSLLSEVGVPVRFPARGKAPLERVAVDREILTFTWRAFLAVNAEAATVKNLDLDIEVERAPGEIVMGMWVGPRIESLGRPSESATFCKEASGSTPPSSCFALSLAEEVIQRRGGRMELWGRPGQSAGLRVHFPASV